MLSQYYYNFYMSLELVSSVPVPLTEYQKSKVCPALMYIQHRHMVCGELRICYDLVLDQNINDTTYSTPFLHEALDVDHKMVVMGIGWYHNTFSHICVKHQHYPEHDNIYLYILFYWLFSYIFPDQ